MRTIHVKAEHYNQVRKDFKSINRERTICRAVFDAVFQETSEIYSVNYTHKDYVRGRYKYLKRHRLEFYKASSILDCGPQRGWNFVIKDIWKVSRMKPFSFKIPGHIERISAHERN